MRYFVKTAIFIGFMFGFTFAFAKENLLSVELNNISINDALYAFAKTLHRNIIISPAVHGKVSLHFNEITASDAYLSMLASNNLYQWKINNAWYVGTKEEFLQFTASENKQKILENETSPLITRIWQIHYAKAADVSHLVEDAKNTLISKRGGVSVDARTNILLVRDIPANMENIDKLIKRIDIPVRQVLIQANIASIDSDYEKELGINFANNTDDSAIHEKGFNVAVMHLPGHSYLNMQLLALEKTGHGELISSPSLFTASQQTAVIESGEEIPYQESSSSGATSVTFKKAVLSLKVTPQIMPNEQILLQLQVNQDKPSKRVVLGVPAINTRLVATNVRIRSGQTIVLGGIYEMNKEHSQEGIPYLKNIPLIGFLFRQTNYSNNKRELLIFVTPTVIH